MKEKLEGFRNGTSITLPGVTLNASAS
jgi:hypothetical protein